MRACMCVCVCVCVQMRACMRVCVCADMWVCRSTRVTSPRPSTLNREKILNGWLDLSLSAVVASGGAKKERDTCCIVSTALKEQETLYCIVS